MQYRPLNIGESIDLLMQIKQIFESLGVDLGERVDESIKWGRYFDVELASNYDSTICYVFRVTAENARFYNPKYQNKKDLPWNSLQQKIS
jgi:hypothetical protein